MCDTLGFALTHRTNNMKEILQPYAQGETRTRKGRVSRGILRPLCTPDKSGRQRTYIGRERVTWHTLWTRADNSGQVLPREYPDCFRVPSLVFRGARTAVEKRFVGGAR